MTNRMTHQLEVSNLITPLINTFKSLSNEWDNYFKIGLSDYLHSQTEKYYFTNTFLHRSEKVRFHNIYYPIKSSYKRVTTDFSNLEEIFSEYKNITLVGSAGSGKTTLLKYIFLNAINLNKKIPILIELRNLNEYDGNFEKLIAEKILKSKVKPSDNLFIRTLESGNFIFLLDGYDEIFSKRKQEINRQIELFIDAYSNNNFLITTRPGSGIENFARFYDFSICELKNKDVTGFISKIVSEEERKHRITTLISDSKNKDYIEYLRNPLLLSMFIMTFENHPEIPRKKNAFYRNVFDTLYSRHDGWTKNSFPREKLTKLQQDEFENILSIFSYMTLMEGQYTFTYEYLSDTLNKIKSKLDTNYNAEDLINDFRTSISILVLDGFEYYFPHRSMQEYFTALFISKLPTDKKKTAYNNLVNSSVRSGTDNSYNFWKLCLELDESVFKSSFIIPNLKKIKSRLKSKRGDNLIHEYLQLFDPKLYFSSRADEKAKSPMGLLTSSNFNDSIVSICNIQNSLKLYQLSKKPNCQATLLNLYDELKDDFELGISIKVIGNDKIFTALKAHRITDVISEFISDIESTIKEFSEDIAKKKNTIDDLLGI